MSHPNTERDERVRQIRDERAALESMDVSLEWMKQAYFQHVDYLLSLYDSQAAATASPTPAESESPILAFDKWLMRYVSDCGKLSQREYGIACAAFIAAHPGQGPISTTFNDLMAAAPADTDESLIALLLDWRKSYSEDIFSPWTIKEAQMIHTEFPGAVDRISAESARGTIDHIIADIREGKHRAAEDNDAEK